MEMITMKTLSRAKPENVRRLAKSLKIDVVGKSLREIAELILEYNKNAPIEKIAPHFWKLFGDSAEVPEKF